MTHLDHEKLHVYQASIDLIALVEGIVEHLPRGRGYLIDQHKELLFQFLSILRKEQENFLEMRKVDFIEWQRDLRLSVLGFLMYVCV